MAAGVPSGLQGLAVLVIGCKVGALLAHRWVAAGGVAQLAVIVGGGRGRGPIGLGVGRLWSASIMSLLGQAFENCCYP